MKKKTVNALIKRSLSVALALTFVFCLGAVYAGAVGKALEAGNDAESDVARKDFTITGRETAGYKPEKSFIPVPGFTNSVNELSADYYRSSSPLLASEVKVDKTGNRGVHVDSRDETDYIIEQIEEEIVPVALRDQTHGDVFFPFFCMVIALIAELYYIKKYKAYQEAIYELRAKLLGGSFRGRE